MDTANTLVLPFASNRIELTAEMPHSPPSGLRSHSSRGSSVSSLQIISPSPYINASPIHVCCGCDLRFLWSYWYLHNNTLFPHKFSDASFDIGKLLPISTISVVFVALFVSCHANTRQPAHDCIIMERRLGERHQHHRHALRRLADCRHYMPKFIRPKNLDRVHRLSRLNTLFFRAMLVPRPARRTGQRRRGSSTDTAHVRWSW